MKRTFSIIALTFAGAGVFAQAGGGCNVPGCNLTGRELIENGDFDQGFSGFTSAYTFNNNCATGGVYGNGFVWQTFDINPVMTCYGIPDRNGGDGPVIHFPDLLNTNPGDVLWSQTVPVASWQTYNFSYFVYEPTANCPYQPQGTMYEVYINGILVCSDNVGGCSSWNQKIYQWSSGASTSALIEIVNVATNFNDFDPSIGYQSGPDPLFDGFSMRQCMPEPCRKTGSNLFVNGEFNNGFTGYQSQFTQSSGCAPGGIYGNGYHWKKFNINPVTTCYAIPDHAGGNGRAIHFPDILAADVGMVMLGQDVNVTANKTYNLSFYVYEGNHNCDYVATGTNFDVVINNVLICGENVGSCGSWIKKLYQWSSGTNTQAQIRILVGPNNYNQIHLPYQAGSDPFFDNFELYECNFPDGGRITGIEDEGLQRTLTVAPNPGKDLFNVTVKKAGTYKISVFDIRGAFVTEMAFTGTEAAIDLSAHDSGLYYLNVEGADEPLRVKIMKE